MRRLTIAILLTLLPTLTPGLFAAESYSPTEVEANKFSLETARDNVQRGFSSCNVGNPAKVQAMPDIITVSWSSGTFLVFQFRELQDIKLTYTDSSFWKSHVASSLEISAKGHFFQDGKEYLAFNGKCTGLGKDWAKYLADALLRLKLEYDKSNNSESMSRFKEEALRYQAANPKPELPEEARRFRVQAEAAVAAKRFLDAAEKYGHAIEIAPWWPEAHFNRGVVLAELQNFDSAIMEMKRYLLLKPEAPDARQAQDFIYVWETHPFEKK